MILGHDTNVDFSVCFVQPVAVEYRGLVWHESPRPSSVPVFPLHTPWARDDEDDQLDPPQFFPGLVAWKHS